MSNETNYPKDDENTIFIKYSPSLAEILEKAKEKWPDITPNQIIINTEYRHVEHLGYDLHDPTDYINYIVVSRQNIE